MSVQVEIQVDFFISRKKPLLHVVSHEQLVFCSFAPFIMAEDRLKAAVVSILDQAQKTFASHDRCTKAMRRIYRKNRTLFKEEFQAHLNRILIIDSKEASVERLVQFFVDFTVYLGQSPSLQSTESQIEDEDSEKPEESSEKEEEEAPKKKGGRKKKGSKKKSKKEIEKEKKQKEKEKKRKAKEKEEEDEIDTTFPSEIMKYLLGLTDVKDKAVRYRSTQMLAKLLNQMEDIEWQFTSLTSQQLDLGRCRRENDDSNQRQKSESSMSSCSCFSQITRSK